MGFYFIFYECTGVTQDSPSFSFLQQNWRLKPQSRQYLLSGTFLGSGHLNGDDENHLEFE
ncbi:unnamed protein product [Cunninghamella blakesleeana]